MRLTRDDTAVFDLLPDELVARVFRGVECDDGAALRSVCFQWRCVRGDAIACKCRVEDLIANVMLTGDRRSMMHLLQTHRREISNANLWGELALSIGALSCPAENGTANPSNADSAGHLMILACESGEHSLVKELLERRIEPTTKTVYAACERLHRFGDARPLEVLMECATTASVDQVEQLLMEAAAAAAGENEERSIAMCVNDIFSSPYLSVYLRAQCLTVAFVYLLRWDARFAANKTNYLLALESAVVSKDARSAADLFDKCGLKAEWLTRSHVCLLAESGWAKLLQIALDAHPDMAIEAMERTIIARAPTSPECIAVAAKCAVINEFRALSIVQLIARVGNDAMMMALLTNTESITRHLTLNLLLQLAWTFKWAETLQLLVQRVRVEPGEPPAYISTVVDAIVEWALTCNHTELVVGIVQLVRVPLSPDTVTRIARYARTWKTTAAQKVDTIICAMKARPELFAQLT